MMEKKFSSQIMQLRFMQRAVEKSQEPSPEQRSQIQERWVVEGARDRCIVLMEGDPAMPCEGRLTFSSGRNENDDGAVEIGNPDHQTLENKESEAVKGTNDPQNQSKPSLGKRNLERLDTRKSEAHGAQFKKPPDLKGMDSSGAFSKRKPKRQRSR